MASSPGKRSSSSFNFPQKKKARLFASQDGDDKAQAGAKVDPTYGQRGAFPGLDGDGEDELFYGPADDGLAYLRMVRYVFSLNLLLDLLKIEAEIFNLQADAETGLRQEEYPISLLLQKRSLPWKAQRRRTSTHLTKWELKGGIPMAHTRLRLTL